MTRAEAARAFGMSINSFERHVQPELKRIEALLAPSLTFHAPPDPNLDRAGYGGGEAPKTARSNGIFAGRDRRKRLTAENLS